MRGFDYLHSEVNTYTKSIIYTKSYKAGQEAERLRTKKIIKKLQVITQPYEYCGLAQENSNETTTACADCVLEELKKRLGKKEPEKKEAKE